MLLFFPAESVMKVYVTCSHNIIYDMTLSTEYWLCHVIEDVLEKMRQKMSHTRQSWSAIVCQKA